MALAAVFSAERSAQPHERELMTDAPDARDKVFTALVAASRRVKAGDGDG
jgi:hypothetical protein